MSYLVFALLAVNSINGIAAAANNWQIIPRTSNTISTTVGATGGPEKQVSWRKLQSPNERSFAVDELAKTTRNADADLANRKSKALGGLAFLAGLSVDGLTGAATSDPNTYAKLSALRLNPAVSRMQPRIDAVYDIYPYATHPYVFVAPFRTVSLWDILRLQFVNGMQNNARPLAENSQTLEALQTVSKPDSLNVQDEYLDETKRIESVKASNSVDESVEKIVEFRGEADRNAEEKMTSHASCNVQNVGKPMPESSMKNANQVAREKGDDSSTAGHLPKAANATNQGANTSQKNSTGTDGTIVKNEGNTTDATNSTQTSTANSTDTSPYGYYAGYTQNLNYIDLTTDAYEHKYHDYEENYHLPTYNAPGKFYPDDRYNYYHVPSVDSYPSSQFHPEQVPTYYSNNFKRFVYASDNESPFVNSNFRPVV